MSEADADQEFYDDNEEADEISELSSSPSIPEGEIDFNFVYALRTFMATVEGQATSDKGDTLVLLDDTNSYWWLVRNIKDDSIGYLPAEHIETPPERLARLNKYRNVDNGAAQMMDFSPTTKSSGSRKFSLRKPRKPMGKAVSFSSPRFIVYEVLESESEAEDGVAPIEIQQDGAHIQDLNGQSALQHDTTTFASREVESRESALAPGILASPSSTTSHHDHNLEKIESNNSQKDVSDMRHTHKNSQSSFQSSEAGSSVTEDGETAKDGKKKKNVFSGLFKKRSKREKPNAVNTATTAVAETRQSSKFDSQAKVDPPQTRSAESVVVASQNDHIAPLQTRVNTSELPDAVKELRSSVMMQTDPVSVDLVEEPHARGPVDEVEMLHAQRNVRSSQSMRQVQQEENPVEQEQFVWTDRAIEAYLESEQDMYKRLLTVVHLQAKAARNRPDYRPSVVNHSFDNIEQSINQMLKV